MNEALPDIPTSLRAQMAEIGPRWQINRPGNIQAMIIAFTEVLKRTSRKDIIVRRDVVYGAHSRQQFDVYSPCDQGRRRAALLFVHGGAFMDGHRNRTDMIYSNVPAYVARNGVVGINMGYRLGGDATYPAGTEDVASVVAWTRTHAQELGVDKDRIVLMGHSAGAAHAASYCRRPGARRPYCAQRPRPR